MYRSRAVLDAGYDKIICSLTLLRRLPLASSCDEASDLLKGPPVTSPIDYSNILVESQEFSAVAHGLAHSLAAVNHRHVQRLCLPPQLLPLMAM